MRRSGHVTTSWVTALALGIVLAWMIPTAALAQEIEPTAEALEEQIRELRLQAGYAEAAEVARELVAVRKGDSEAKPFEIADAERLVEALQHIAGLPDEGRRELALADTLDDLTVECREKGRYAEGIEAAERLLEIRRRYLGDEHPDVATSLNDLASLLWKQGDYAGAERLNREALATRKRLLGNEHPDVAESLNNLANLLRAQADYAGAEPLYRKALAMRRELLGDEHLDVAESLNNLAGLLRARGDYAGAEPLLREALAMRKKLLGDEHRRVA